jgi:hypothetical protein
MSKEKDIESQTLITKPDKPKMRYHIEGGVEIAMGVGLLIAPYAVAAVAALGCAALTVKKFFDEPKLNEAGEKRSWWERTKAAASMAFGATVGTLTIMGGAAVALVGLGQAFSGNAASFDLVQGAIVGMAAQVAVPAISLVLIGEGTYKAVTGKPCNVLGYTYDKCKSAFNSISNFCGMTQTPTKENVKQATTTVARDLVSGTQDVKAETAKRDPGLYENITGGVTSAANSLKRMVVGGATEATSVDKKGSKPPQPKKKSGKEK